jgi:hypothetical protein
MSKVFINEIEKDKGLEIEGIPISDIVDSIKRAIVLKQLDMDKSGIKIKDMELTLKTVAAADVGAKISLQIPILGKIEFGSKISEKSLQTTNLTLKVPGPTEVERGLGLADLDETIADSISNIIEGVKAANDNSPSLEMEEASVEFNFVLSGDSKISLIIESGFESELSNKLKITFEKK